MMMKIAKAENCKVTGTPEKFVERMNLAATKLFQNIYGSYGSINTKKCAFRQAADKTGLYTCPIGNYSKIEIYTDRYKNATAIFISGDAVNKEPREETFYWALYAVSEACGESYQDEIENIFIDVYKYTANKLRNVTMACGMDPDLYNTWIYMIVNDK